ncbi:hypothetical protein EDB19DRAFT_1737193, partial [Suillus lakei]
METNDFVSFIIFWVVCLPLLLLKPESCVLVNFSVMPALNHATANGYRVPAMIAAVLVLIATLAVFLWAIVKQGNGGPLFSNPEAVYGVGTFKVL